MAIANNNKIRGKVSTAKESFNIEKYKNHILIVILLITIAAYANCFKNNFTDWDDKDTIVNNKEIKDLSVNSIKHFFSEGNVGMYQPFTDIVFSVEYYFAGLNATVFHTTSFLLHLLNVVLVFILIYTLSKKVTVAAFVSLFFAIHPMHVESVAWISELKDVLYSAFYLGGIIFYIKYLTNTDKYKYLILTLLMFIMSLLSKSAAVTLPLMLMLVDYYHDRKFNAKSIIEKLPFFALSIVFGIISIYTQKATNHTNEYTQLFNVFDKFLLVCYNVVYYIFNLFFPFKLSAIHPFPNKAGGFLPIEYYISPLLIGLLVFAIFKLRKYSKDIAFGMLFFIVSIILVIQIIPIGMAVVAERYTYIPYIGLLFVLAQSYYLIEKFSNKLFKKISNYIVIGTVIYAIIFTGITIKQNTVWKDSITLWTNVIDNYSEVAFAYNARGYAYYSELNDNNAAINDYTMAIKYKSDFTDAWFNIATCKVILKDYEGAIKDFEMTIKYDPKYGEAYANMAYAKQYGLKDLKGALADYYNALKILKDDQMLYYNIANIKYELKDYKGAIDDYTNCLKFSNNADAMYNRAGVKLTIEDYIGALDDYNATLKINPEYKQLSLYYNRGLAKYKGAKDYQGALNDFNIAENYFKEDINLYLYRGNIKAALLDYKGALQDYDNCLQLNPDNKEAKQKREEIRKK